LLSFTARSDFGDTEGLTVKLHAARSSNKQKVIDVLVIPTTIVEDLQPALQERFVVPGDLGGREFALDKRCTFSDQMPSRLDPVPGYFSGRIAYVVHGDGFRGTKGIGSFHGSTLIPPADNGMHYQCDNESIAIQHAIVQSQLKHVLQPLEKAGFLVDVILAAYDCDGILLPENVIINSTALLASWYNGDYERVIAHRGFSHREVETQGEQWLLTVDLLARQLRAGRRYEAVMFWRLDHVAPQPLVFGIRPEWASKRASTMKELHAAVASMREKKQFAPILFRELTWAHDDQNWLFPGWKIGCFIAAVLKGCSITNTEMKTPLGTCESQWNQALTGSAMDVTWSGRFPPGANTMQDAVEVKWPVPVTPAIYRGPFPNEYWSGGALRMCHLLHRQFGGPSCRADDVAKKVCRTCLRYFNRASSSPQQCIQMYWDSVKGLSANAEEKHMRSLLVKLTGRDDLALDESANATPAPGACT
jgi:hypothetical protein